MMPTVSVIVPAHEGRATVLPRALHSICTQVGEFELQVIVVDDGSPDSALREVTEATSARNPSVRLDFSRIPVNAGPAAALNVGLDVARGDWIAVCGSDNEFVPFRLARQLAVPDVTDTTVVTGSLIWRPGNTATQDAVRHADADDLLLHRFGVSIFPHLFPRAVFETHRFDPALRSWEDWDLTLRLLRAGIRYVDCGVVVGVVNNDAADRLTASVAMAESLEYLLSKYDADVRAHRGCRAAWEFRIGRRYALVGDTVRGLRWIRRSLRHDPLQPRRIAFAVRLARNGTPPPWNPYP